MTTLRVLNVDDVPDGVGDVFDPDGLEVPSTPVNVYLNNSPEKLIGTAQLQYSPEERCVKATISWLNGFNKDPLLGKFYPSIGGVVLERDDTLIKKARIGFVSISFGYNSDRRILSIGEQEKP